jgi:hypothetical protein
MPFDMKLLIALAAASRLAACEAAPPNGVGYGASPPAPPSAAPFNLPETEQPGHFSPLPEITRLPDDSPPPEASPLMGEGEIIGEFKTPILDKDPNRVNNLQIASRTLDNCTVESGREFSFNNALGERTPEKGYKKAIMIDGDSKKKVYGGGVCQISSTLYNAAELAGMEILQRNDHSKDVGYVEKGDDAAVSFGSLDFSFKNVLEHPITIAMWIDGEYVYAAIKKGGNR